MKSQHSIRSHLFHTLGMAALLLMPSQSPAAEEPVTLESLQKQMQK